MGTMRIWSLVFGLLALMMAGPGVAQQAGSWVQVEAQPDLRTATDRARAYAATFPQVQGYKLRSGWFAIAIGPMSPAEAQADLGTLSGQGRVPADSFVTDGANFRDQFWPEPASATDTAPAPATEAPAPQAPMPQTPAPQVPAPGTAAAGSATSDTAMAANAAPVPAPEAPPETLRDARAAEAQLAPTDRQDLQTALKWFGFYDGKIDGSFGAGTRNSMAAWQSAKGFDPTGVLTTAQRKALMEGYKGEEAAFGFETVTEAESGIEITLPMAMLSFDRYTPPFARYQARDGSGLTAMLISEPGTKASLAGLYEVLQTLDIVPPGGERTLGETSFTIHSRNDTIETQAYVTIAGNNVKGYLLSWNVALSDRMQRVLPLVQSSFRSTGEKALDPGLVPLDEAVRRGLLAGLDVKKPRLSRSGFFIDDKGTVLTTSAAVDQCGHVTLEHDLAARVSFEDKAKGIAVLTPEAPLAPVAVAGFASSPSAPGTEIAVSGYSYQGRLPASVLTRGTLEEAQGLNGEPGLARLTLRAMDGDAGGPVLDGSGAVVGMLLAPDPASGRDLPPGVVFAATAAELSQVLTDPQGPALTLKAAMPAAKATPDALNAAARGMTVLVSCWE
ncbi:peptidoglycan-binding protein [bacterium]|nr:peptidoglycan-binding protein [bacterium]